MDFFSTDWISALWKKLQDIRKYRKQELDEINNIIFGDPLEIAQYYVEPKCQERNPADRHEEDFLVAKEPVMDKVEQFFDRKIFNPGDNQMFIFSDAGMGKTALLTMLKLRHLTAFWPQQKDCVLKKLGETTLGEVAAIENKRETILLLDSLDEDPTVSQNPAGRTPNASNLADNNPTASNLVKDRLLEILEATQHFFRVIITCRTQFFPDIEEAHLERQGKVSAGGFNCPVKYISFFDDKMVTEYLNKRFPKKFGLLSPKKKIEKAREVIKKMGSLRCRPMLLSYVEDFMDDSPLLETGDSEYKIYDVLVRRWLEREQQKDKNINEVTVRNLLHACIILATHMQIRQKRSISKENLKLLTDKIKTVKPVRRIDLQGRSLLNCNSEGDYRFSHYSIQEFLVAKLLLEEPVLNPRQPIPVTDFIFEKLLTSGKKLNFPDLIDFSKISFSNFAGTPLKTDSGLEFVFIPPGEFMMGSPEDETGRYDNETLHHVTLTKGFFMQTTPVTQGQWKAVMADNPSYFENGGDNCPVENVSWNDAQQFIEKLNDQEGKNLYRLPTEAEWEYACRARSSTRFCFGDDENRLSEYAWYDSKTHPVGQKKTNAWGLYDMHGNVVEWCQDWYGDYPSGNVTDPTGTLKGSGRVGRGGGYLNSARNCRSARRGRGEPGARGGSLGFRLLRLAP